jgi:hypothetical protein
MAEEKASAHERKKEKNTMKKFIEKMFASTAEIDVPTDELNRFNIILQKMMNTRWYITMIVLMTFLLLLLGIVISIVFKAHITQEWKEILLLLLGAFIGSYNRVIDFWFNNSQRDDKLIEKVDEENDSADELASKTSLKKGEQKIKGKEVNDASPT